MFQDKKTLWLFIVPAMAIILIFMVYPFVRGVSYSFLDIKMLGSEKGDFVWFKNYADMLKDRTVHTALFNTIFMIMLTIFVQIGVALVLALMVDSIGRAGKFFRTVYFFPIVISATAIGLMFNLFYAYNGGMFNQILDHMGREPIVWLAGGRQFFMVMLPVIWQYVGFYFVIILTGLAGIPQDIFESAKIDGVDGLKKVFKLSIPLIWDVLVVCVILGVTGALKVFDLPWVIAPNGAPAGSTHLLGTYLYFKTFISGNVGFGSAMAVLIVVLGVAASMLLRKVLKREQVIY